jgi:hypothetical protein
MPASKMVPCSALFNLITEAVSNAVCHSRLPAAGRRKRNLIKNLIKKFLNKRL